MGLADSAAQALTEAQKKSRVDAVARRNNFIDAALGEKWESTWKYKGDVTEAPTIDSHDLVKIDGSSAIIAVCDGIKFLYSETYRDSGWGMLRTCPDCGALVKVHFYGLSDIGATHAREQAKKPLETHVHRCYENSVNALASSLLLEAKALKLSVTDLASRAIDKALERGGF